ncbi:heme uptake protein IsdC [Paenibacillus sp. IB182496]|uniref:Heme uptake protein IsdC n=1 Tax=Paenibacillus sabuli TaxID=2772509 RepID=A0A927GRK2_9BACL|nr:heme uptake protein IsdC [Paenibacillus sabuli]MBD2845070.1 heme uptake protein IsdC [Paenibacillus sabuli]
MRIIIIIILEYIKKRMMTHMRGFAFYLAAAILVMALALPVANIQAEGGIADGTYAVDYLVLKAENDSVSMANDYWEKPAMVVVEGGAATVRLTINHSAWVTAFKVPGGSGFLDTQVIEANEADDTRLVEFKVEDLTRPLEAKIHVTVSDIDYDHDYTIRMAFDTEELSASGQVQADEEIVGATDQPHEAANQADPEPSGEEAASATNGQAEPPAADRETSQGPTAGSEEEPAKQTASGDGAREDAPAGDGADNAGRADAPAQDTSSQQQQEQEGQGTSENDGTPLTTTPSDTADTADTAASIAKEAEVDSADVNASIKYDQPSNHLEEDASSASKDATALAAEQTGTNGAQSESVMAAAEHPLSGGTDSSNSVWWPSIGALFILLCGVWYILRRKRRVRKA